MLLSQKRCLDFFKFISLPLSLFIITIIAYIPSLNYAFQFDDYPNIVKFFDIRYKGLGDLIFLSPRWISLWLNTVFYSLGKFEPYYYRVGAITIHILSAITLFFMLYLALSKLKNNIFITKYRYWISIFTTALFLLHPVQSQNVSYVIQSQLEGTFTLITLLIILLFLIYSNLQTSWAKTITFIFIIAMTIIGMGTKEIFVVMPALLLLVDWFFISQGNFKDLKSRLYFHLAIWGVVFANVVYFKSQKFFVIKFTVHSNCGNMLTDVKSRSAITLYNFFISQFKVVLHYLWIFFWPFGISVDYDTILSKSFFDIDCWLPFLVLIALLIFFIRRFIKNPTDLITFGFLWFFIALLPRTSIFPGGELITDYKTYFSSIGMFFIFSYLLLQLYSLILSKFDIATTEGGKRPNSLSLSELDITTTANDKKHDLLTLSRCRTSKSMSNILYVFLFVLTSFLAYSTYQRNKVWSCEESFWANIIEMAPKKARGYNNYGASLYHAGDYQKSKVNLLKAIALDPKYPDAWNNIALVYKILGEDDRAIESLKKSIYYHPGQAEVHNNLGAFLLEFKKYDQVEEPLRHAIKMRPHYGKAWFNIGRLRKVQGDMQGAYDAFKKSCFEADCDNEVGFCVWANFCLEIKKIDDAIFGFTKALSFNSDSIEAIFGMANCMLLKGQFEKAIDFYMRLINLKQNDPRIFAGLADCYFGLRQYDSAFHYYSQVSSLWQIQMRIVECLINLGKKQEALETLHRLKSGNFGKECDAAVAMLFNMANKL